MKTGIELISEERQDQIVKHGFTSKRDDSYTNLELQRAAVFAITGAREYYPEDWDLEWKVRIQAKSEIGRLIVAGALIAAEIDRLQREKMEYVVNLKKCWCVKIYYWCRRPLN